MQNLVPDGRITLRTGVNLKDCDPGVRAGSTILEDMAVGPC